jgi:L-iditol 2-dehydrogenase
VAIHAVMERTTVHAGDLVLVSGPGCVGILTMLVAKMEGAKVIVTGTARDNLRLACARELGADVVVNISKEDPLEIVRHYSKGEGADAVYECAGAAASLDMCWEAVRRGGTLMPVGIYPGKINTDFNKITMKELRVMGSFGYVWTSWQRCIQLLSEGKVNTEALISHELPLGRFEEAFRWSQDGSAIKVV